MDISLTEISATELAALIRAKKVSCREVVDAFLSRIASEDPALGSYITVDEEGARQQADLAQVHIDAGGGGPLCGLPIALKDNLSTTGVRTTCASKVLQNYVPPFDATVVAKLKESGMVLIGKTNLDEFAMGTSCENSAFQITRNPWDHDRSPGGSSGGSAACVAGNLAPLSLGSDTGGSIRLPAALCGIVGFKPTYGRVSRYGLVAFASSLDQIGPFARTVEDAAAISGIISGHDPLDSTSLPMEPISARAQKDGSLKGLRLAVPKELLTDSVQPGVRRAIDETMALLSKEGVIFKTVSLPTIAYGVTTYYIIAPAEASSNLARFDGVRYGTRVEGGGHVESVAVTRGSLFGHEVKARIMMGTYVLSAGYYDAYYTRAQQVRGLMIAEFEEAYRDCDAVFSPTSPSVAFKLGELAGDPLAMKLLDFCTIPANMGGFPAISLCAGLSDGLPVGMQLTGPVCADEKLLQMAYSIEQALPSVTRPASATA